MIRPLGDRIVVERIEAETTTPGGVVLPDVAQEKPSRGKVLAVGKGAFDAHAAHSRVPIDVKVGDVVLFTKYGGVETTTDDKHVVILREGDLLGVEEAEAF